MEDDYDEQMQDQLDMQSDQEQENRIVANGSAMVENRLELIAQVMSPDRNDLTRFNIKEEELKESLAKEFLDITKDLALANIDTMERETIIEYNELIGFELRNGLWKTALSDLRTVKSRLLTSRSLKGKNLELLFTIITKFEKLTKKDTKAER